MAGPKIKLDHQGIAELLKSPEMAAPINAVAKEIAIACGGEWEAYTTDRRAALVKVDAARQARDGALTRAAAAVGLEVRQRS